MLQARRAPAPAARASSAARCELHAWAVAPFFAEAAVGGAHARAAGEGGAAHFGAMSSCDRFKARRHAKRSGRVRGPVAVAPSGAAERARSKRRRQGAWLEAWRRAGRRGGAASGRRLAVEGCSGPVSSACGRRAARPRAGGGAGSACRHCFRQRVRPHAARPHVGGGAGGACAALRARHGQHGDVAPGRFVHVCRVLAAWLRRCLRSDAWWRTSRPVTYREGGDDRLQAMPCTWCLCAIAFKFPMCLA